MRRILVAATMACSCAAVAAQSVAPASFNPRAMELFESDWVLMDWGLRVHDRDGDAQLSPDEASAGAQAFRKLADADNDGRVTPHEFRRAREFLLARY